MLDTDYRLMTSLDGWRRRGRRSGAIAMHARPMPGDKNHLFRWEIPRLEAPHELVFEAFVHRVLEYHGHWTKEFLGGEVVDEIAPDAVVVHQRFTSGVPGVSPRDLCYLAVTRRIDERTLQASYRSVDAVPPLAGYERIRWWGANLCIAGEQPGTSSMIYLDRENPGGSFPAWLMNLMMPNYLRLQCEALIRFFAAGGPPELRAPTAA